ncbi:unnamed protein product [Caenorhabditis angaria]|uniref:Uncharacterized protein n=1 Tax=Caenorhabditis angaria TaxID=860376 RepID=A0A9P1N2E0_9PELO|nr:unnamed protein product [Caenorhabditis angaria]
MYRIFLPTRCQVRFPVPANPNKKKQPFSSILKTSTSGINGLYSAKVQVMGNGMRKYSQCDAYYKKRRKTNDVNNGANFTKDYCEYWKNKTNATRNSKDDNFSIERNNYSFANSYESPLRNSRKQQQSQFISSFDGPSNNYSTTSTWKR